MSARYLYIHVPFCLRRCSYCDFAVHATQTAPVDAWLESIDRELELVRREQGWDRLALETVYLGGGTPSLLGPGAVPRLIERLEAHASWGSDVEFTAEANPESFTRELAFDWKAAGVNRISLGAQTFDPAVLRWMGRLHGSDGPARAVAVAGEAGIENVSIDLIFGVPARFGRDWAADLRRVIDLRPAHVSLYGLTAEAATPLGRWVSEGRETLMEEDSYADEYRLAADMLGAAGFEHYEVSNFARPGRRSRHNGAYWTGAAYVGLGPGAHSFYPPRRAWNVRSWDAYRDALAEGRLPRDDEETVEAEARRLEAIWLGLRTADGLDLAGWSSAASGLAETWRAHGWAAVDGPRLRLTTEGWLLLDRLTVEMEAVA